MTRKIKSSYQKEMTLNEQLVYINLKLSTFNKSNTTNILPETLANRTDLKVNTINKVLNTLTEYGLIERMGSMIKVNGLEHFEFFTQDLLGTVSNKSAMVALRMAACRLRGTASIKMLDKNIIERIGLSKQTFTDAKKELIANGILIKDREGYIMDTTFFPLICPTVSEAFRSRAAVLLQIADQEGYNSASRVFKYYYDKGFEGLRMSPDDLVEYCEIGCPGINHNKMTDTYDFPEEYQF